MSCPCDERIWPPTLSIAAGLDDLPRQLVTFADLRAQMLSRARMQPALSAWSGRASDDYGVMFLELWSYVGELLAIYDKAIADESYVRTAKLRPSLRRLVAALGYVPRPAVAATAEVALLAEGVRPLVVPVGVAFRSGAFGAEKPQVFELTKPATLHPALNQWSLAAPYATTIAGSTTKLLVDPATARVAAGDVVLVELTASNVNVRTVKAANRTLDRSGRRVLEVTLDRPVDAGSGVPIAGVRIRRTTRKASLKSPSAINGDLPSFFALFAYVFVLDGLYRDIHMGERMLVEYGGELRWATVSKRVDDTYTLSAGGPSTSTTIEDSQGNVTGSVEVPMPPIYATYTVITTNDYLDDPARKATAASPNWAPITDVTGFTVHWGFTDAGAILGEPRATLSPTDPLRALDTRPPVNTTAAMTRLLLRDAEDGAAAVSADIDLSTGDITLGGGESWAPPLANPVDGFGNVVRITRGESVASEVLGDGDASQSHQTFKLQKKPLTYVTAPGTDSGVASTLTVWVDGVRWDEVPTLYGHDGNARVYTIRQDDDAVSWVTFGDGIRGARLPTGTENVVASYRHGAGAAAPPAGSISQLAKPVPGLKSIVAPLAAGGGADAEPAASLARLAPRSALLLGRAISIEDMEAAAFLTPGVITARADWAWDGTRQRPVVKVWVVGDATTPAAVTARLLALTEPNTPIYTTAATAVPVTLTIDLELDPRRVAETVLASVTNAMTGDDGWLQPAALGIDRPLFRSELVVRLLDIPGVTGVRGLTWNGTQFAGYGQGPGVGAYFHIHLTVTGS